MENSSKKALSLGAIGTGIGLLAGAKYFFDIGIKRQENSKIVKANDYDPTYENQDWYEKWFEKQAKVVTMDSVTGVVVTGYEFINKKTDKWIIVVHGYTSNAKHMAKYIKEFYDMGYSVFAPDLIAHGQSMGKYISMGGFDSQDLALWAKTLTEKYQDVTIGLFGVSMGATTVMMSLNKMPKEVKLFIEDSGFIDLITQLKYQLRTIYRIPGNILVPLISAITKKKAGYSFGGINTKENIIMNELPALILQGDEDTFVPIQNSIEVYESLFSPKKIHIFKGYGHCMAGKKAPHYFGIIKDFLDRFMVKTSSE